jgi:HK97 family phage major capsid protein
MSSKTRNYLAGLKDSTGRSYFVPGTSNSLDMILGYPVVINQSLPSPTAGAFSASVKPIIFADLYSGLQVIASEPRVAVLRERFAEVNESALVTSIRIGSSSLQAGAIQELRIAAA